MTKVLSEEEARGHSHHGAYSIKCPLFDSHEALRAVYKEASAQAQRHFDVAEQLRAELEKARAEQENIRNDAGKRIAEVLDERDALAQQAKLWSETALAMYAAACPLWATDGRPESMIANCSRFREGVEQERDELLAAAKEAIPQGEHPTEKTIHNWAWQLKTLGQDRRYCYEQRGVALARVEEAESTLTTVQANLIGTHAKLVESNGARHELAIVILRQSP